MSRRHLGSRTIAAYNRLSREVAALNYLIRIAKPAGTLGEAARRSLNNTLRLANRVYQRETGLANFALFDPIDPLTMADVVLLVTRLTSAGIEFEERYAHLTQSHAERLEDKKRYPTML